MPTITVYSFQDQDGDESGTFTTQNYQEAKAHAQQYKLRVMGNEYEWTEAVPLDDFTDSATNKLEEELRDAWEGEGNSSRVSFEDWVEDMANDPRGTLQEAAQQYLDAN